MWLTYVSGGAPRPVVGVTTYVTNARWGYWDAEAALIPFDYVQKIERAGGRALLIPPSTDGVEVTLDAVDAIVFTGGSDIDPELYGEHVHPQTFGISRMRDDAELALLRVALERDMPVLGVCRGIQLLNVGMGGDLLQHVPEVVGHEGHKNDPPGQFIQHEVEIEPGTRLGDMLGTRTRVMSHHHQGVRTLAPGLVETAHADDGLLEAVEAPEKRFAVGVQWHPEAGEDSRLFDALVSEAARYRIEKSRQAFGAFQRLLNEI